ncbi:MAG TPA: hypothetical protein VIU61_27245 [Kofleriaceae bacterium]
MRQPRNSSRVIAMQRTTAREVIDRARVNRGFLFVLALAACGDDPTPITIIAPAELTPAMHEFVELTPYDSLALGVEPRGLTIELAVDLTCRECYRIEESGPDHWIVHTGDVLGAQYGAAHALENLGFRFRHPFDTYVPAAPAFDPAAELGVLHEPHVPGERGLQLHTLHPIEAYFALWESNDERQARQIFDWIVKNRGNHVQWPALDDIMEPARHADWVAHTTALLDAAHARGLTAGLGMQIFGSGNMQNAFDLSDSDTIPFETEMAQRLPLVTALPFDDYVLAFGEFFGEDAERFIAAVNATVAAIKQARPDAGIHASVHVGADQRVTYMGEDLPYYFLVKYADPAIIPNIHTVMYYNLFEDAGGAYGHADFAEHREYLMQRIAANQPAVYYPESAYWIAFDNSVPLFLPLYVRSRWLDLDRLPGLQGHLVFSSGWEWGYWLHDVASLRASYALPDSHEALIADAYGRDLGPEAARLVAALAELQATALIEQRLAPYLSGRDALIDAGDTLGIHSQPDRVTFADLVAADPTARAAFERDVLAPLVAFAGELERLRDEIHALALPASRWSRELVDGFEVTAARARFIASAYEVALAHLAGAPTGDARARVDAAFAAGEAAVRRRHDDLHEPDRERAIGRPLNVTFYGYGYLHQADSQCYWRREQVQLDDLLASTSTAAPHCFL